MKVRQERRVRNVGMGGPRLEDRVVTLDEGAVVPHHAEAVPDSTPEHDWQPVKPQAASAPTTAAPVEG